VRFLYLDDSGKPEPQHPSKVLAFAGFSVDQRKWHDVVRQISGAKGAHFPGRGKPWKWEVKGEDFLTANAWKRSKHRQFCSELVGILRRNECTVYATWVVKANATKPLDQNWVVPLCFQRLAAKFERELVEWGTHGAIVCDWSTYPLDRHVSNCVQSFVLKHEITSIVGGVSYGSSRSVATIQACDLIVGAYRRFAEGQTHLRDFVDSLRGLVRNRNGETDALGRPSVSECQIF
jgi:hypothetical protein